MATDTTSQIKSFLSHIGLPPMAGSTFRDPSLSFLADLITHAQSSILFQTLNLHYSPKHTLTLEPDHLLDQLINRGMGGYCMENNLLMATALRTLGFEVLSVGARVSDATAGVSGGGYNGWNHMANLVRVNGTRYLVDIGFRQCTPSRVMPLIVGVSTDEKEEQVKNMIESPLSQMKLTYTRLPQHTDPAQRAWVYSYRASSSAAWTAAYSFVEIEFFAEDYAVMNLSTMTLPESFFAREVMCVRGIRGEEGSTEGLRIQGLLILFRNYVKRVTARGEEHIEMFKTEEAGVKALERWFGIKLTEEEKDGIKGRMSELRG